MLLLEGDDGLAGQRPEDPVHRQAGVVDGVQFGLQLVDAAALVALRQDVGQLSSFTADPAGAAGCDGEALALSRAALVRGPTMPSAGVTPCCCWKVMTACRVSGPKIPSTGRPAWSMVFSSVCSWFTQPPW